ncbi:MAG: 50S ribosome-binding GTPase [Thermoprotei archaeon]|nr:50S ribosome-binding GTPase [Thermoprotei archaeon]
MRLASWRMIARLVRSSDVVLEVVDIRDPMSTMSRRLEKIVEAFDKTLLIVLNKCDLVPRSVAEGWKSYLEGLGYKSMYVSATSRLGTRILRGWIKANAPTKPFTVAVVGYPKTGKSSVINALRGRRGASTSPVPGSYGYTRSLQLFKVEEGFYIIDTPGIIPVEGGWPEAIIRGKAPEEIPDPLPAAVALIEKILKYNRRALLDAYGIEEIDPYKALEALALKRGWRYKSTGEPLIEEAARTVIRDYHTAKLYFYVTPPS